MYYSRRQFLTIASTASAFLTTSCATSYGHKSSYISQVLKPQNRNTVFHWVDIALQQVRDQRVSPPRAAYNYALPMATGFLAANGIIQAYDEPFGIGPGPGGADSEVAYGSAFAVAAAEAFQQPFFFERLAFLNRIPGSEAKSPGIEWGRSVGRSLVKCASTAVLNPVKPIII